MNLPSLASLAALAAAALLMPLAACGDSVGAYCDYTDCNAAADAGVDVAVEGAALTPDAD